MLTPGPGMGIGIAGLAGAVGAILCDWITKPSTGPATDGGPGSDSPQPSSPGTSGMPNPDGDGGGSPTAMPGPDGDSGGSAVSMTMGGVGVTSPTYPAGSGVDGYIAATGSGSFLLQGMPQFAISGQSLQLSNAGVLGAIPDVSNRSWPLSGTEGSLGVGSPVTDPLAGLSAQTLAGLSETTLSSQSQEALRFIGEGVARALTTKGVRASS
jgi:hypothetical protein